MGSNEIKVHDIPERKCHCENNHHIINICKLTKRIKTTILPPNAVSYLRYTDLLGLARNWGIEKGSESQTGTLNFKC